MAEDNKTPYEIYEEKEMAELGNFFLLTFSPNPDRDNVKIVIPTSGFTTTMKRSKFISIIDSLTDNKLHGILKTVCNYYGGYFMIDRKNCICKPLTNLGDTTNHAAIMVQEERKRLEHAASKPNTPIYTDYASVLSKQMSGILNVDPFRHR